MCFAVRRVCDLNTALQLESSSSADLHFNSISAGRKLVLDHTLMYLDTH